MNSCIPATVHAKHSASTLGPETLFLCINQPEMGLFPMCTPNKWRNIQDGIFYNKGENLVAIQMCITNRMSK